LVSPYFLAKTVRPVCHIGILPLKTEKKTKQILPFLLQHTTTVDIHQFTLIAEFLGTPPLNITNSITSDNVSRRGTIA
jgi:hypothetical protein